VFPGVGSPAGVGALDDRRGPRRRSGPPRTPDAAGGY
jgi:hypothetical protein